MYRLLIAAWLVLASPLRAGGVNIIEANEPAPAASVTRCQEGVVNGDFEDPYYWAWTQTSNQAHNLIDESYPHSGLKNADLGGTWNSHDTLSRMDMFMLTLPSRA